MEEKDVVASIAQVRTLRDQVRDALKKADKKAFSDQKFGGESEFSYRGLLGGLDSLMIDVSTLTGSPKQFLKISSFADRQQIITTLNSIVQHIETPKHLSQLVDQLKSDLRSFNIRQRDERYIEFEERVDEVMRLKLKIEESCQETEAIKKNIQEQKKEVDSILGEIQSSKESEEELLGERLENFDTKIAEGEEVRSKLESRANELEEIVINLEAIEETVQEHQETITEALTESKSNEKLITSFAARVEEREDKLAKLEKRTEANTKLIAIYEAERKKILRDADTLIKSAKLALEYKTAEGLSSAFIAEKDEIGMTSGTGWLVGAVFSLSVAVAIGCWIALGDAGFNMLIGRLALIPLPLGAAVFCAKQYIKRANLLTDYAYKSVLAKSIVGFSEQLRGEGKEASEEYVHYIKTALEEIHKDPLRNRSKEMGKDIKPMDLSSLIDAAEKISKLSKSISKD